MPVGELILKQLRAELESVRVKMDRALVQLGDADVDWRPTENSNTISELVLHICQYFDQVLEKLGAPGHPAGELAPQQQWTAPQLRTYLSGAAGALSDALAELPPQRFLEPTDLRGQQVPLGTVLMRYALRHAAEHMGQVLYLAKMRLGSAYRGVTGSQWESGSGR